MSDGTKIAVGQHCTFKKYKKLHCMLKSTIEDRFVRSRDER